jgi:hypothetical protein
MNMPGQPVGGDSVEAEDHGLEEVKQCLNFRISTELWRMIRVQMSDPRG